MNWYVIEMMKNLGKHLRAATDTGKVVMQYSRQMLSCYLMGLRDSGGDISENEHRVRHQGVGYGIMSAQCGS